MDVVFWFRRLNFKLIYSLKSFQRNNLNKTISRKRFQGNLGEQNIS